MYLNGCITFIYHHSHSNRPHTMQDSNLEVFAFNFKGRNFGA